MTTTMIIERTSRLTLSRFTEADAPFIVELLNDADFLRHIGDRNVRTEPDAIKYLRAGPLDSYARHGFGLYRMGLTDSGTPVGMCGLLQRDYLEAPDLGFALLPRYRRRGLTAEAARAVLAHGRRDLGLKRVLAITSLENTASIELLTGLGFVWERHLHRENQQLNVLGRQQ